MTKIFYSSIAVSLMAWAAMAADSSPDRYLDKEKRTLSPGNTTYVIDPVKGDDANLAGKPWKTFGKLNALTLAPGDKVLVVPGQQEESLKPAGGGTADNPVVIQFLPGIHTINIRNVTRVPLIVSNTMDSDDPMPVGILLEGCKHLRLQGGGVEGEKK